MSESIELCANQVLHAWVVGTPKWLNITSDPTILTENGSESTFGWVQGCIVLWMIGIFLCLVFYKCVPENHCVVMQSRGKYTRTLEYGIHYCPMFEFAKTFSWTKSGGTQQDCYNSLGDIPMDEQVFDLKDYEFDTKDRTEIIADSTTTYRIVDPRKAVYNTKNLWTSMEKGIQRAIREVLGNDKSDFLIKQSVVEMNESVRKLIHEKFKTWGVEVLSFKFVHIERTRKFDEYNNDQEIEKEEEEDNELDKEILQEDDV